MSSAYHDATVHNIQYAQAEGRTIMPFNSRFRSHADCGSRSVMRNTDYSPAMFAALNTGAAPPLYGSQEWLPYKGGAEAGARSHTGNQDTGPVTL